MYGNLYLALKEKGVRQSDVAQLLKLSKQSVYMKLHGIRDFTAPEMYAIKEKYFPNGNMEELFKKREQI